MQAISGWIVFADAHLLVLDKPAGLLCVPGRGADKQDCLSARAQAEFPDALVVHRLDMATSGLCVLARGMAMQKRMSAIFADREVVKRYVAVVAGRMKPVSMEGWETIDLPIAADWPNRPRRVIDAAAGKPSVTRWRPLAFEQVTGTTRVALEPLTGRTHQLRVHLQAIGHPILGDSLYAPSHVVALSPRLLLHAESLHFAHPATGEPMAFNSPATF